VLGDADIVWYLDPALDQANEPLGRGQHYTPQRLYTRAETDVVSYYNRNRRPYTVRDAVTGELLFRPVAFTPDESAVQVGKDRMLLFTVRGCRAHQEWRMKGVAPYVSATLDGWFDPRKQ